MRTEKYAIKLNEECSRFRVVSNTDIYNSNFEHLLEELSRIDLMVRAQLQKYRDNQYYMDDFRGLYISEDEIDEILKNLNYGFKTDKDSNLELEQIKEISVEINRKKNETVKRGTELRLLKLSEFFHLDSFELDVVLICLAPELDSQYETLYSYLQNDVTKKLPNVDLIMKLLCLSKEEKFKARKYFFSEAPLIKNVIIHLDGEETQRQLPLLAKSIKLDERIINFLLEYDEIDYSLRNFSSIIYPKKTFNDLVLAEDDKKALVDIVRYQIYNKNPVMFLFYGPYGTGKMTASEAICNELGRKMLIVDSKYLMNSEPFEALAVILREAILQKSSLYFEDFDELLDNNKFDFSLKKIIQKLDTHSNWIFLSSKQPWDMKSFLKNNLFVSCPFHMPSFNTRKQLWNLYLKNNYALSDNVDINALANKFKLSGGQIKDAIFTAYNDAMKKNPYKTILGMEDLYQGCKSQSNKKISTLAQKIDSHHTWDDIILPKDTKDQLKEVCGFINYRRTVYTDWGFDKKLSLGKGLNVLFSGLSGTGKTMTAGIIAREVDLEIYKIDLSSIVSKYIGETEKKLETIFREAEYSNAILFFDEADALFGKRTNVKDAHDRYANIETNYLLQKIEEHEGIVIMASNFKNNMDDAFLRRLQFTVEFPFPDEQSRQIIWKNIFPVETPIGENVDFSFLSKFKITGGNIKNIALSAAFLAAADGGIVEVEHIIKSTKREFQKMGKICTQNDFREYYELVR